jgi:hypothetical protein
MFPTLTIQSNLSRSIQAAPLATTSYNDQELGQAPAGVKTAQRFAFIVAMNRMKILS